jgi:hypothetical protein
VTVELEHLVQKEDTMMSQTDFAWAWLRSAANQGDVRDGVVRRAERRIDQQPRSRRYQTGHRVYCCRFNSLVEGQRRQDARQSSRHHCLASTGRADEQQIVATGGGNLKRATGEQLSAHVAEIRRVRSSDHRRANLNQRRRCSRLVQRLDGLDERPHREHIQA